MNTEFGTAYILARKLCEELEEDCEKTKEEYEKDIKEAFDALYSFID